MKSTLCIFLVCLLAPLTLVAGNVNSDANSASAAFERIKSLAGTWRVESAMGSGQSVYEVVANGTTVIERFTHDGMPSPMITAYHLDGSMLELTHYCMAGNQPSMVASRIDPGSGEIVFDFAGISNLTDPNGKYMHNATFKLADNEHFTSAWTLYENAKPKATETLQYTRIH